MLKTPHLLLLLFLLAGCRNQNEYKDPCYISGRIIDEGTRFPVKNASVKMYEEFWSGSNSHYGSFDFGPDYTDENGNYSLECEPLHENARQRNMLIFGPHAGLQPTFFSASIKPGTTLVIDTTVTTKSYFSLFFQNVTPVSNNDSVYDIYIERPWGNQFLKGQAVLYGQTVYAPLRASYYGYSESVLHFSVNKTGTPQHFIDTLRVNDRFADLQINDTISY